KWGRDEITSDFVRLIRMIRPDVVIAMMPGGAGGGQHHQASAVLSREAVKLSGDASKFPEQLKEGLRPWQPRKFYFITGFGPPGEQNASDTLARINLSVYDPLLGKTYFEIGTEARSMHKCQGMAQLLALPGPFATTYRLTETTIGGAMDRNEADLFDGIEHGIGALAQFAGANPPPELTAGLARVAASVKDAQAAFDRQADDRTTAPLVAGLREVRQLRAQLGRLTIDEGARYEIDFRLRQKETEFSRAIVIASGLELEALADDGVVVAGQTVKVSVILANRGSAEIGVKQVAFKGFDG